MKEMRSYKLDKDIIEMLELIAKKQRRSYGNVIEILVEKEFDSKKEEYLQAKETQ